MFREKRLDNAIYFLRGTCLLEAIDGVPVKILLVIVNLNRAINILG